MKMKKTDPKKPHAPKARRRYRHPTYKGPITNRELEDILETLAAMSYRSEFLVDMAKRMGVRPSQLLLTIRDLMGGKPPASTKKCVCRGACLCHTGVQIAAVPCPPGCPNAGTRFDGCHRCDCSKKGSKP